MAAAQGRGQNWCPSHDVMASPLLHWTEDQGLPFCSSEGVWNGAVFDYTYKLPFRKTWMKECISSWEAGKPQASTGHF